MTDREMLEHLIEEVHALRAAVARLSPEPRLTRKDRAVLQRLLPAVHAQFGSREFLICHLLDEQRLTPLCDGRSSKALGKLFSRTAGSPVSGFTLERFGEERGSALWRVTTWGLSGFSRGVRAA